MRGGGVVQGWTHLQHTPAAHGWFAVHDCGSGGLGLGRQAGGSDVGEDADDVSAHRVR